MIRRMRVTEIFGSIQGETTRSGCLASFVRLDGCNLHCTWCDTAYARQGGREMSVDAILQAILDLGMDTVVVTGGEPLIQPETPALLTVLAAAHPHVILMTNGTLPLDQVPTTVIKVVDIKTPWSHETIPGLSEDTIPPDPPHLRLANLYLLTPIDEIKAVVRDRREFQWYAAFCERHRLFDRVGAVLVAPAWGLLEPTLLVDWMKASGRPFRLNLQWHKYLYGERQGV